MSQESYSLSMSEAVAGLPADAAGAPQNILSYSNPNDEILFGVAVVQASGADDACDLPDASDDIFLGISVRDLTEENGSASADNTYPVNSRVSVMSKGRIWVKVEVAVAIGDTPYARYTANGGNTHLGAFRVNDDTNRAAIFPSARFLTSTSGAGIALLEVNLP